MVITLQYIQIRNHYVIPLKLKGIVTSSLKNAALVVYVPRYPAELDVRKMKHTHRESNRLVKFRAKGRKEAMVRDRSMETLEQVSFKLNLEKIDGTELAEIRENWS